MGLRKSALEDMAIDKLLVENVLITGGTGFIGSHLIRRLLTDHYSIILLKKKTSNIWRIADVISRIKVYDVNLHTDFNGLLKKEKINGIIHLAGKYIKTVSTSKDIKELNTSNMTFPALLLDAAVQNGVKYFINTGTFTEYRLKGVISENTKIEPYNYYAAAKIAFESILKYYAYGGKIKAVTLKLFSPYGEKDNVKIIPLLCKSFRDEKKLALTQGRQRLSFTYISDIVDAYVKTVLFLRSDKYKQYEVFNIGSNESWSIQDIVNKIRQISKKPGKVQFGQLQLPKDETVNIKCDSRNAKKMLKWHPKVRIGDGLERTYRYYSNLGRS